MKRIITLVLLLFTLTVTVKAQAIDSVGSADQEMIFDGAIGYGPERAYPWFDTSIKFFDGRPCTLEVYEEMIYVDNVTGHVHDTIRVPVRYYDNEIQDFVASGVFIYDGDPQIQRIWIPGQYDRGRLRILTRTSTFPATKIMVSW